MALDRSSGWDAARMSAFAAPAGLSTGSWEEIFTNKQIRGRFMTGPTSPEEKAMSDATSNPTHNVIENRGIDNPKTCRLRTLFSLALVIASSAVLAAQDQSAPSAKEWSPNVSFERRLEQLLPHGAETLAATERSPATPAPLDRA